MNLSRNYGARKDSHRLKKLEFKPSDFKDYSWRHAIQNKSKQRMVVYLNDAVKAAQERYDSHQRERVAELREQIAKIKERLAKGDSWAPGELDSILN